MKMTSKLARMVRRGVLPAPCLYEHCSDCVDSFIPSPPVDKIRGQLPEDYKFGTFDGMKIIDMRNASEFLFAGDDFQKIDAAKRLQNEHVARLAKKYYKPKS